MRCRDRRSAAAAAAASRRSAQLNRLVDAPAVPASGAPVVQAQLIVRVPVGRPDPAPQVPRDAGDPVAARGWRTIHQGSDLCGERRRDALVGVEREDPVVRREPRGVVFLRAIPRPPAHFHPRRQALRDRHRPIGAARIDDDRFVGPGDRLERRGDVGGFVFRDDRNGQLHARQFNSEGAPWHSGTGTLAPFYLPPPIGESWTASKFTSERL